MDKKACPRAGGTAVFADCAMCCKSEDPAARDCAERAARRMADSYDLAVTRRKGIRNAGGVG